MSEFTPGSANEPEDRNIFPLISAFVGAIAALDLWSAFNPTAWNWGFHVLAFYSIEIQIAVPFLMLLMLVPPVQFFLIDLMRSAVAFMNASSGILRWLLGVAAIGGLGFAFIHFHAATYFLGDGYGRLQSIKAPGNSDIFSAAGFTEQPLAAFFVYQTSQLFNFFESSTPFEDAYLWLDVLSGLCFALIAWKGAGLFAGDGTDRVLTFLLFVASGTSLLFFGFVENDALGYVGIFLFLLLGVAFLQEKISLYWSIIAYGLVLSLNFCVAVFAPILAYLIFVGVQRKETMKAGAAIIVSALLFSAMLMISGYSPALLRQVLLDTTTGILSTTSATGKPQAYGMFSMNHLADISNLFLFCSPAALALFTVAVVSMMKTKKRLSDGEWYMLLVLVCAIGAIVLMNCTIGMSRDWNVAVPFIAGVSVAVVAFWMFIVEDRETRQRVVMILTVVMSLQTVVWVGLYADEPRSVAQFETLEEGKLWGTQACLSAYAELAQYHRERREYAQAAVCYERYVAIDSTNYHMWLDCARMEQTAGNYDKAVDAYKVLAQSGPATPDILAPLGVLLARLGRFDEGFFYLKEAEKLSPESPKIKNDIGALFANEKKYAKALPYFLDAVRLDPNFQGGYFNAASCYTALGDNEKAREYSLMGREKK
ncbi:MAG TPA: tetratricopeptide repeat protein [Bacteroidota bacterium]|nr:tetratricopeptide repeat protein [Bacteroidota bacterium]